MAQYSVDPGLLYETADEFSRLAAELDSARERLGTVLADWQESVPDWLRRQLTGTGETVGDASRKAASMGRALCAISDGYARAERSVFSSREQEVPAVPGIRAAAAPAIRRAAWLPLTGDIILPEWLQIATLRYEQSTGPEP